MSEKKEDRNKVSKSRTVNECLQHLYQAEATGDTVRVRMWKAILAKIQAQNGKDKK